MNIEQARFNMVEQQIRPWDVLDQSVLDLLFVVKREDFVPPAYKALAFTDVEIPLGFSQVMLCPKVEAKLLQESTIKKTDRVLEIGTGSGYMAALLAARAEYVVSVEINPELAAQACRNLEAAAISNVTVEVGDGSQGWAQRGPYDVIIVSGSVQTLPEVLLRQLRLGGRLAVIVGNGPVMEAQLITCTADGVYNAVNMFETVLPPLANFQPASRFEL
jgi:protein-L-isoaspartate(D-aspartate) O-methyltransferase